MISLNHGSDSEFSPANCRATCHLAYLTQDHGWVNTESDDRIIRLTVRSAHCSRRFRRTPSARLRLAPGTVRYYCDWPGIRSRSCGSMISEVRVTPGPSSKFARVGLY
eukprot:165834-Hanusia_phi.AAC.1